MERQKRPKLAGAGTLATFWEALFFGPFKATVIVRRVSRIAKSDCQLHRVMCLCVCLHGTSRLPRDKFS